MDEKWVGKSLTVWGGLVVALPGLAKIFGFELGDLAELQAAGNAVINGLATVVGFFMVIIGRMRAKGPARLV